MILWSVAAGGYGVSHVFFGGAWNIKEIVYDNNYLRPSYALNYKTPIEYRTQLGFN